MKITEHVVRDPEELRSGCGEAACGSAPGAQGLAEEAESSSIRWGALFRIRMMNLG